MPRKPTGAPAGARGAKKPAARKRSKPAQPVAQAEVAPSATAAPPVKQDPAPGWRRLRVRQTRSGIGHAGRYRRTLEALGLKHHQDEVIVRDHPAIRGMLRAVWHLVSVHPVEE